MKPKRDIFVFANQKWYLLTEVDVDYLLATDNDGGDHELKYDDIEFCEVNGKRKDLPKNPKNDLTFMESLV